MPQIPILKGFEALNVNAADRNRTIMDILKH